MPEQMLQSQNTFVQRKRQNEFQNAKKKSTTCFGNPLQKSTEYLIKRTDFRILVTRSKCRIYQNKWQHECRVCIKAPEYEQNQASRRKLGEWRPVTAVWSNSNPAGDHQPVQAVVSGMFTIVYLYISEALPVTCRHWLPFTPGAGYVRQLPQVLGLWSTTDRENGGYNNSAQQANDVVVLSPSTKYIYPVYY